MQSSKEKKVQNTNIRVSKETRHNFDVRHPEMIPQKAKDEFKRVPKY